MKSIKVRPARPNDPIEVGTTVFVPSHKDFVKDYQITAAKDVSDSFTTIRSFHMKSPFGSETGFSIVRRHADGTDPASALFACPRENAAGEFMATQEERSAYMDEIHGQINDVISSQIYVLAEPCPNDTNGDGDCGRAHCPYCGEVENVRLIEAEGVLVTMQVFVPNDTIDHYLDYHYAAADSEPRPDSADGRKEAAVDHVEDMVRGGVNDACYDAEVVIDYASGRLSSENHVHVFDQDARLLAQDTRAHMGVPMHMSIVADALEVDVLEVQREIIRSTAMREAEDHISHRKAMASVNRGRRN